MGEQQEDMAARGPGQHQCGEQPVINHDATAALAKSLGEKFFEARVAAGMTYAPGWWVLTEGERAEHEMGALSFAASLSHDETATALIQASEARANRAEAALREAADELKIEARANEMSANIMRDRRRTGGWDGAERTAAAFDRHGLKAAGIRAKLLRALNPNNEA